MAELVPPGVERACHDRPEERPHLGAGDEVATTPGMAAPCVEPGVTVVESEVDQLVEAERADAADPLADEGCYLPGDATP